MKMKLSRHRQQSWKWDILKDVLFFSAIYLVLQDKRIKQGKDKNYKAKEIIGGRT